MALSRLESIRDPGTWPPAFPKDGGLLATHASHCCSLLLVAAVAAAADADAGDLTICNAVADASAGSTTNMSNAIAGAIAGAGAGAGAGAADVWTGCLC